MRFGLKTMFVALALVSVTIGVMGKLWIENPEAFFQTLMIATTVGPFLIAVGTIIWLGLRGSKPAGWILVGWGSLLLVTPVLGIGARLLLLPSGQPIRVLSTERMMRDRLPKQIDEPWVWNELVYRANRGTLSTEQVDNALQTLIDHMKKTSPQGRNKPLSWQGEFIRLVRQKKLISDEVLLKLCEAFYGPRPMLNPISPLQPGRNRFALRVEYGNPWGEHSKLGVALIWHGKRGHGRRHTGDSRGTADGVRSRVVLLLQNGPDRRSL